MKHLLFFIAALLMSTAASAQTVKAITQHGETVVLFENGTWKYEKDLDKVNVTTPTSAPSAVAPVTAPAIGNVGIDDSKEATSEKKELFNAVSKKLSRFFGDEKGRVRCSAAATNTKGEISLDFEFMMPIGDANRYFGVTVLGRTVSFQLSDGSVISKTFTTNIEEKFIDKWNVSYYKAGITLNKDDVSKLLRNNALRMTIDWKKVEEEYIFDNVTGLQIMLAEVL